MILEFGRVALSSLAIRVLGLFLSLALAFVLARSLGASGYGEYAFYFSIASIILMPAQFGLPSLVVRETAKGLSVSQYETVKGVWLWANHFVLRVLALLVLAIISVFIFVVPELSDSRKIGFLLAFCLVFSIVLVNISGSKLRGLGRVLIGQLPERVIRPSLFLALIGCFLLVGAQELTVPLMFGLHCAGTSIALVGAVVLTRRFSPPEIRIAHPVIHSRDWVRSILPLGLLGGIRLIEQHTDLIMLGIVHEDEIVGVYKVVTQCASLVVFGLAAVNMIAAPKFSGLLNDATPENLKKYVGLTTLACVVVALPAALFFIFFGNWVLSFVFGEEFSSGYVALIVIVLAQVINAFFGCVALLLNMASKERVTLYGVSLGVLANVLLNLILIPVYGMLGAALATMFSTMIWNWYLWRELC